MANTPYYTKAETDAIISSISSGFRAAIDLTSPSPTEAGVYIPTESGTYTNYGSVVVDLTDGIVLVTFDGVNYDVQTTEIDLNGYVSDNDISYSIGKNKFNKDTAQPGYINSADGVAYPGGTTYSYSDFIPVTAGQYYGKGDILIAGTNSDGMRYVAFYDENQVNIPGGISPFNKLITIPSGVYYIRITIGQANLDTFQLETGTVATSYEPYTREIVSIKNVDIKNANKDVYSVDDIDSILGRDILKRDMVYLNVSDNNIKIRTPYSQTKDLVHSWQKNTDRNGIFYPMGVTVNNLTDYGSGTSIHAFNDNVAPFRAEELAIGGAHGVILPLVSLTAHGKTSSDLLSEWTDGTHNFYLIAIPNENSLQFYGKKYTGVNGDHIPYSFSSTTLTHVSGAVNTSSINVSSITLPQVYPTVKNKVLKIYIDGKEVTSNGEYWGREVVLSDSHEVVDIREITLQTPFATDSAPAWIKNNFTYKYNIFGFTIDNKVDYRDDYFENSYGVMQCQRMTPGADSTTNIKIYLPNSNVYGSNDYRGLVDFTSVNTTAIFGTANVEDNSKPVQRAIEILKTSLGVAKYGMAHGYFYSIGDSSVSERASLTDQWEIRNSTAKSYPKVVNNYPSSGQVEHYMAYFSYFNPELNQNATAVYIVQEGNSLVLYIDYHSTHTKDYVLLPKIAWGKEIEVIDGNGGIAINSGSFVPDSGIVVTTSLVNGYAYGVYKLK